MLDRNAAPGISVLQTRLLRALIIVGIVLGTLGIVDLAASIVDRVHTTLIVIIFAILFAYIVYPPIKWVARYRIPVPLAGVLVYLVLGILLLGALIWLAPAIGAQATELAKAYPKLAANVQSSLQDPRHAPLLAKLPPDIRNAIASNAGKVGTIAGAAAAGFGAHALDIVSGTTAVIVNTSLALALALLFVSDLARIQAFGIRLIPRRSRPGAIDFLRDVDQVVGGFARGQVLLAFAVAAAGTIVLVVAQVPYAILLGLLAGVISIVPMIGAYVALVPVAAITYATTLDPVKTIVVVVLFVVITQIQQQVLIPLVVAKSVGVTPLVIFLALLFGSEAFGILGALLSIPIAGILRVAAERIFPADAESDAIFLEARAGDREPRAATEKAVAREARPS